MGTSSSSFNPAILWPNQRRKIEEYKRLWGPDSLKKRLITISKQGFSNMRIRSP
jgi:hypothetical protein